MKKNNVKKLWSDTEQVIVNIFKSDIQDDSITMIPWMDHRCHSAVMYQFNDDALVLSKNPDGTSFRTQITIQKMAELYGDVISSELSNEENLKKMIEKDIANEMKNVWYFRLHLEKIQNPFFIDMRPEFNKLFLEYQAGPDHEKALKIIGKSLNDFITRIESEIGA